MMGHDLIGKLSGFSAAHGPFARVTVAGTEGSAPREAGASMLVGGRTFEGTIGGGQLEFEALAHARALLAEGRQNGQPWLRELKSWPLGPALGQCCGGMVRLLFEHFGPAEMDALAALRGMPGEPGVVARPCASGEPLRHFDERQTAYALPLHVAGMVSDMLSGARPRRAVLIRARKGEPAYFIEPAGRDPKPLYIYGAGHVGRAIVRAVEGLDFAVRWADTHVKRFPDPLPAGVTPIAAPNLAAVAQAAPEGAYHLVLTYSHPLDLAICHALLSRPLFGFLGLIGSQSKRARFLKRLRETGVSEAALARLTCPIGLGAIRGKAPAVIAIAAAAQLVERLEAERREAQHGTARHEAGALRRPA